MSGPTITFDITNLTRHLDDDAKRQVPFALSRTLNATVLDMQAAIRNVVTGRTFTVRTPASRQWLRNSIKIERYDRATKHNLVARVRISPPGKGGGRAGLLGFLEGGGVRFSQYAIGSGAVFGPGSVAVPLRDPDSQVVPRSLYPSMTGLQERRSIDGGLSKGSLKGKRRTFAIRTGAGVGLILQRKGKAGKKRRAPGERDPQLKVIFAIKPRVRVSAANFFFPTAERIATARFEPNMEAAFAEALRTAK